MTIDRLEVWCAGEEWCPITTTSKLIGKKRHPVIIDRLLDSGPLGFNALQREVGSISNKVLSETLEDLEENELVDREIVSQKPVRVEYSRTEYGDSLKPVIEAMNEWGTEYLKPLADPQ